MAITVTKTVLSALSIQVQNAQQELYQLRLAISTLLTGEVGETVTEMADFHANIKEREEMAAIEEEECYT